MSTIPRHAEPEIDAFLVIGGYADIEEWMRDSDYLETDEGWVDLDDNPTWPTDAIAGAMEACHGDDEEELLRLEEAILGMIADGILVPPQTAELTRLYRVRLGLA